MKHFNMKKGLLFVATLLLTLNVDAQKVVDGSIPSLKGENKINLKIDFSETLIDNKSIEDWLEYRQATQPKDDAKKELESELKPVAKQKLTDILNDKFQKNGVFFTNNNNAKYTLIVKPVNVSMKGNNTNECSIIDDANKVLVKFQVVGSGGRLGSMRNLWGDGYDDTAKKIASFIKKCFK